MILVLEGLRGVAAVIVAIYHSWPSDIRTVFFILNGWLWVDLFFVLSGSVMRLTYSGRLNNYLDLKSFAIKRFGRLYPLHLATTLAFVFAVSVAVPWASAVAKVYFGKAPNIPSEYLSNVASMLDQLPFHILLVHGLGFIEQIGLNYPSWSISAEFAVYLIWAMIWLCTAMRKVWSLIAISATVLLLAFLYFYVSRPSFGYMGDFGLLRCLVGFSVGTLLPNAWVRLRDAPAKWLPQITQLAGLLLTGALFFFASSIPSITYLAPLVFGLLILGLVSYDSAITRVLVARPLVILGKLSYSIYLWHVPILLFFKPAMISSPSWVGSIGLVAYLSLLIAIASMSYKYLESPSRKFFAKIAAK